MDNYTFCSIGFVFSCAMEALCLSVLPKKGLEKKGLIIMAMIIFVVVGLIFASRIWQ